MILFVVLILILVLIVLFVLGVLRILYLSVPIAIPGCFVGVLSYRFPHMGLMVETC